MHLALIGYGEVGRILAEDLRAQGHEVTAFDLKLRTSAGVPLRGHSVVHGVTLRRLTPTPCAGRRSPSRP